MTWDDPRVTRIRPGETLWLEWDEPAHAAEVEIALDANDHYGLKCRATLGEIQVPWVVAARSEDPRAGLTVHLRWTETWRVVPASERVRRPTGVRPLRVASERGEPSAGNGGRRRPRVSGRTGSEPTGGARRGPDRRIARSSHLPSLRS